MSIWRGIVNQYQISYIELDRDLAIDKVLRHLHPDSTAVAFALISFDLMNALLKPKGLRLKHMWLDASPRLAFPGSEKKSEKMRVYILQVMSILPPNLLFARIPIFLASWAGETRFATLTVRAGKKFLSRTSQTLKTYGIPLFRHWNPPSR